jgi:regulator of protease activity HflC (stomatin/prohibitin superfamily)
MGASDLFLPILLVIVIAVAYQSFAIAHENERFAVFFLGRFYKFNGPGLVFKTNLMKLVRLRIGDLGTVTGPEFVRFGESDVPVPQASEFHVGDVVRILSFTDSGPFLTRSDETSSLHCPNCGHEFQGP